MKPVNSYYRKHNQKHVLHPLKGAKTVARTQNLLNGH